MSNNSNTNLNMGIVPRISCGGDFKSIVTKSTIFVDKSLFIKEAIENPAEVILITMPRRTGKSTNMDMLKRFLSIQVNEEGQIQEKNQNAALFFGGDIDLEERGIKTLKPLKITQEKLKFTTSFEIETAELQGKYPVISIDFKSCKGDSLEGIKSKLKTILQKCFSNHSYLKNSDKLSEEEKQEFCLYNGIQSCRQLSDVQIHTGIQYLSELLYKHHGKKVWILIDEYDAAANKAYREFSDFDEAQKIADLFRSMFEPALKGNEYLEKGILTGVQYIVKSGMLSDLNNIKKYNVTNFKFSQYYGINQEEMEILLDHFNIEDGKRKQIKSWYNGYFEKIPSTENYRDKYNIWSIVNYLNNQDDGFKSYWEKSGDASFLKKLFVQRKIKEKIKSLIDKKSIGFNLIIDFSVDDFKALKEISDLGSNKEINNDGLSVLFSYLFITGYLTTSSLSGYKLPNEELRYEMERKIVQYYDTLYRVDFDKIKNLTNTLHSIVNCTQEDKGLFIKNAFKDQFMPKFAELIKECNFTDRRDENDGNGIFANEDAAHSILNYISMQIKHAFVATEIYTQKIGSEDKGRADILVETENTGLIIEVKHKGKAEEALEQAKTYAPLIEDSRDKVFIALNITENKEVTFAVEINIDGEESMRF